MGNIYVKQKKYPQAVKMYRMALDQIDDRFKAVRWEDMMGGECSASNGSSMECKGFIFWEKISVYCNASTPNLML